MTQRFSDQLKSKLEQGKGSSADQLTEKFNQASLILIERFLDEVLTQNIVLDDTADLTRLFQIFAEINNIKEMGEGEGGKLPPLSSRQSNSIRKFVETELEETETGEEEEYIDPMSLDSLTEDVLSDMLSQRAVDLNEDNAGVDEDEEQRRGGII